MRVQADTDNGKVVIDPSRILNFSPVGLDQTDVDHDTDGERVTVRVNHSLMQIAQVVAQAAMPHERECCGTFAGSPHRATCAKYRGKKTPNADVTGLAPSQEKK
jgi:hypothetical protein